MNQDIKRNICNGEQWQHTAWIVFFIICYSLVKIVLFTTILFQVIHTLILSKPQKRISRFGAQLASYVYQLIRYMTYNSDVKPFPFDEWPDVTEQSDSHETTAPIDEIQETSPMVEAEVVEQEQAKKKA